MVSKGEDKQSPYDDVKETRYYVAADWIYAGQKRDEAVSGSTGQKYENPPPADLSACHASGDLRLSGFRISFADVGDYIRTEKNGFTPEELEQSCGGYMRNSGIGLQAVADSYGSGMLSSGDEIGDVHIYFSYETLKEASPVTVIGRQRGDRLVLEDTGPVDERERIRPGLVSRQEFLSSVVSEDASSRIYGIVFLALGFVLLTLSILWGKWFG